LTRLEKGMPLTEPINLREWSCETGRLFTCGRPGRALFLTERRPIGEETIDLWIRGLPTFNPIHLVSLLGRKKGKNGHSEFEYYPFRSVHETGDKPTFQEWLNNRYGPRFVVHEFPTTDRAGVPEVTRASAAACIKELLAQGHVVLLIDSAGAERTARVREHIGLTSVRG
jgi:hypothetical protein